MKTDTRWGFVSGRISVLEARFSTKDFFLGVISKESMEDVLPFLQGTFLADLITPGAVWVDFSSLADRCFTGLALSIRDDCPSTVPVDLFLLQGDYLNLKDALTGSSVFRFPFGIFSQQMLQALANGDYAEVPDTVKESLSWKGEGPREVDPATLSAILDAAYLRHLTRLAEKLGSALVTAYVREQVLADLVIVLWRARNQGLSLKDHIRHLLPAGELDTLLPGLAAADSVDAWPALVGGATGRLLSEALEFEGGAQVSGFELKSANHLTALVHDGRYQTAGPERVFVFLQGLATEIRNLKLSIGGRLGRIDRDLLKGRLWDGYV